MAGYIRQSVADIQAGEDILAAPLNAEFNAIRDAFHGSTGHEHDGTTGNGPKIDLTASISGVLPVANGGIAAIHKLNATTTPATGDDSGDGYGVGSLWIDTTNDKFYICVDASLGAAVWNEYQAKSSNLDEYAAVNPTSAGLALLDDADASAQRTTLGLAIGTNVQAYDAGLQSISGLTTASDKTIYTTGSDTYATTDLTSFGRSLIDDADASAARTTLGVVIGTDVQAYSANLDEYAAVNPTTAGLALLDDADASTQRTTLGLAIGTNVQAYDAGLASIAGLTTSADKMIYTSGSDTYVVTGLTSFGRSLVDDADASTARTTLGLTIGTNVQAYDAGLASIAGLTTSADKMIYTSGSDTYAVTSLTSFGRSLIDDADASAGRTTLEITAASFTEFNSATSDRYIKNDSVWGDLAVLTDGASIAVNFNNGYDFGGSSSSALALGGNRALAAPTNARNGKKGILWFTASSSTRTLTLDAAWNLITGIEAGPYSITTSQTLGVAYVCRGTTVYVTGILRIG